MKEISAEELEAACRKCLRVEVSDTRALARVLDAARVDYEILSETAADIYARLNVSRLVSSLGEQGCELLNVQEKGESLESYFLNLLGGERL